MKLGGELGKKRDEKVYERRYNTKRGHMAAWKCRSKEAIGHTEQS